jgi:RES domain-containing protein
MLVYRICRRPYQALDGEGARLYGGRWNTPGTALVYTSSTLALAALEYLVHLDPDLAPADLMALTIDIPDPPRVDTLSAKLLPADWARVPEHPACQALGDEWAQRGAALALRVPSAPIPEEENVLINPRHPDAAQVRVVAAREFAFDPRLVG